MLVIVWQENAKYLGVSGAGSLVCVYVARCAAKLASRVASQGKGAGGQLRAARCRTHGGRIAFSEYTCLSLRRGSMGLFGPPACTG